MKIYENLQEAISHEPENVGEIIYNSNYLRSKLLLEIDHLDVIAINAKLQINNDKISDIILQRKIAQRRALRPSFAEVWGKRLFACLTSSIALALLSRLEWSAIPVFEFLAGVFLGFGLGAAVLVVFYVLLWAFTSTPKQPELQSEIDLFKLTPEQYREKYLK